MLFDTREREREAQADRLVQADAIPAPPVRTDPPAPVHQLAEAHGNGLPQPAVPEQPHPEPPLPAPRFEDEGDFEWIDNPRTSARCKVTFNILILSASIRRYEPHPPIHPSNDYDPHMRVLQQPTEQP
jgi:hypothetical protein